MCVHTHTGKGVKKIGKYRLKSIPFWESQKAWVLVLQESGCVRSSLLDIMETSWVRAKFLYTYTWQCFSNSLKLCKGNVENKGWGCLQFRDFGFVGFFLPSEVCLQCEKLDWIMKQNICKHLPDKSPRVTYKVLVHLSVCFSCAFICITLCLEDRPWLRNSKVLAWINMSKCSSDVHSTSGLLSSFAWFSKLFVHF